MSWNGQGSGGEGGGDAAPRSREEEFPEEAVEFPLLLLEKASVLGGESLRTPLAGWFCVSLVKCETRASAAGSKAQPC